MSNFKIIILLLLIIPGCAKTGSRFYDIDGPKLNFYKITGDNIFFQYNEPVSLLKLNLNEELSVKNDLYTSNITLSKYYFVSSDSPTLQLTAFDAYKNKSVTQISMPVINDNPAKIIIDEIRIKNTKKLPQMIKLRSTHSGSLKGFCLNIYFKDHKEILPFKNTDICEGQCTVINISSDREKFETNKRLNFNDASSDCTFKSKLSQVFSCIIITDNKDDAIDYILYYNLKEHEPSYYEENKNFILYKKELYKRGIKAIYTDISGSTSKKTLKKNNDKYLLN